MSNPWFRVTRDPRPWWAFWRLGTVSISCPTHGTFVTGLHPVITETGFSFVDAAVQIHAASHHKKGKK